MNSNTANSDIDNANMNSNTANSYNENANVHENMGVIPANTIIGSADAISTSLEKVME